MNALTQLALMTKAKRVFETEDTFVSFPVLSPLAYPPARLRFYGPNVDFAALCEFSRLVNQIPRGMVFSATEDAGLWQLYADVLRTASLANDSPSRDDVEAYERAAAVLYVTVAGSRHDSPTYRVYKQYRDLWIAAVEEYKAAQLTAQTTEDPEVKSRWQLTEGPALRDKVTRCERDWEQKGFRRDVERAESYLRVHAEQTSPALVWSEWRDAFNPDIDTLTDPASNQSFAPTAFSPADAFDVEWPSFTLSNDEVNSLVNDAPSELKDVLDLTGTGPQLENVSFEFRSVGLTRPWLRPEVFRARFWRLADSEQALCDGGSPAQGLCPAYVAGVVFARNIVEVNRQPNGNTDRVDVPSMPDLRVRPAYTLPRRVGPAWPAPGSVVPPHRRPYLMSAPLLRERPPAAAHAAAIWDRSLVSRVGLSDRISVSSATTPNRNASALERLTRSAFMISPEARTDTTSSPSAPVTMSSAPNGDISILAFICRWLPKCPDPNPALTWTD